jgi:putative membrane protein
MWITSLWNVLMVFLMLGIPVLLIVLGVSLGLRLLRGNGTRATPVDGKSKRNLYLLLGVLLIAVLFFLSFNIWIPPGQPPLPFLLPMLLILLAQLAFWVLVIAGAVWLVLWLARRMGAVGPARETPLDILKTRYARGEISKAQFEELKRDLG